MSERSRWLHEGLRRLLADVDADAHIYGISLAVSNADGTTMSYVLDFRNDRIRRLVVTDPRGVAQAREIMNTAAVDASVDAP